MSSVFRPRPCKGVRGRKCRPRWTRLPASAYKCPSGHRAFPRRAVTLARSWPHPSGLDIAADEVFNELHMRNYTRVTRSATPLGSQSCRFVLNIHIPARKILTMRHSSVQRESLTILQEVVIYEARSSWEDVSHARVR